jgi:hypothetical protein
MKCGMRRICFTRRGERGGSLLLIQSGDPPSLKLRRASAVRMYLIDRGPILSSPAAALAQAGGDWIKDSSLKNHDSYNMLVC